MIKGRLNLDKTIALPGLTNAWNETRKIRTKQVQTKTKTLINHLFISNTQLLN